MPVRSAEKALHGPAAALLCGAAQWPGRHAWGAPLPGGPLLGRMRSMSSASAVPQPQAGRELELARCAEAVAAAERVLHLAKSGVRKLIESAASLDAAQADA